MLTKNTQRFLSFVMAFLMVFSLFPVQALATETEEHDHDHAEAQVNQELLDSLQATIDDILMYYLGTTQMTTEEVYAAVYAMEDYWTPMGEVYDFENSEAVLSLTEADLILLADSNPTFCDFATALYERRANDPSMSLFATTVTVLDGTVSITDSTTSMTESGGTVTVTAKGGYLSQTTNTITIYNNTDTTATLSFTYSASNYSSFSESDASGTKSELLAAGESITMSIKGKKAISNNTATLTLYG